MFGKIKLKAGEYKNIKEQSTALLAPVMWAKYSHQTAIWAKVCLIHSKYIECRPPSPLGFSSPGC